MKLFSPFNNALYHTHAYVSMLENILVYQAFSKIHLNFEKLIMNYDLATLGFKFCKPVASNFYNFWSLKNHLFCKIVISTFLATLLIFF